MYIDRHISNVIENAKKHYKILLITGARQVGKSTMLKNTIKDVNYVTFDDYIMLGNAKNDTLGFLKTNKPPLILDEVQYIPEIFRSMKLMVDKTEAKGQYFMTGSQVFELMQGVSESLAGRVAIFNLLGLSKREIENNFFTEPFLPTEEYITKFGENNKELDILALWEGIHRGSMPELISNPDLDWGGYYASYLKTYIERDVKKLSQVGDELLFMQFLVSLAGRTGELLNMASLSKDIGVSEPTIKKWISILQASNIVYLLQPFSLNIKNRVVKTPKIYFLDTGLVCYLCKWLTAETLMNGANSGNIYETYVVGEIIKSYYNKGQELSLYFYRDSNSKEIDLLFYQNGTVYPVEIKKTASPNIKDIANFKVLETAFPSVKIGSGGIICSYDKAINLDGRNKIIPISYL
jgi:predicted AAA+ superfamily ATPase